MRSAIEISARSCSSANTRSSSARAMPAGSFSLTTSQSTPAGCSPASTARSTAASVCPGGAARRRPWRAAARRGPGREKSAAVDVGVGEQPDGVRAVGRGDAGRDAFAGVDGDGVRGAAAVLVGVEHRRQVEAVGVGLGHRHADVAGRVADHERDQLGRGQLGGEDEVALVLAVLVVDDDDGLAGLDVGDRALDRVESQRLMSRVPVQQSGDVLGQHVHLQVDRVAGALPPRVVARRVSGIKPTSNQSRPDARRP